jgi:hypothetical protein
MRRYITKFVISVNVTVAHALPAKKLLDQPISAMILRVCQRTAVDRRSVAALDSFQSM